MGSSMSRQDEPNALLQYATQAGKMVLSCLLQITCCALQESHIINLLLTKLVLSRWLDIGLILFFCKFMDLTSVFKHTEKELGQYPAIFTSHLVNNPYFIHNL